MNIYKLPDDIQPREVTFAPISSYSKNRSAFNGYETVHTYNFDHWELTLDFPAFDDDKRRKLEALCTSLSNGIDALLIYPNKYLPASTPVGTGSYISSNYNFYKVVNITGIGTGGTSTSGDVNYNRGAWHLFPNKKNTFDSSSVLSGNDAVGLFRLASDFSFVSHINRNNEISIPLREVAQNGSFKSRDGDNIHELSHFKGYYFYGNDPTVSSDKKYVYPLFLESDQAQNYVDPVSSASATGYAQHTFTEAPDITFYRPTGPIQLNTATADAFPASNIAQYLTRYYESGDCGIYTFQADGTADSLGNTDISSVTTINVEGY